MPCSNAAADFLKARTSATLIQAGFRGAMARGDISAQRYAALMFQSAFRMRKARNNFRVQKNGATLLQAAFRGKLARDTHKGTMTVTVVRGIKLADRELFGKQDPYVVLHLVDQAGVCVCLSTFVSVSCACACTCICICTYICTCARGATMCCLVSVIDERQKDATTVCDFLVMGAVLIRALCVPGCW
jgi:hypothetical protein